MRLRNITGCREMIGESEFVVHEPETMKGKWREAFGNDHPVYVEIGMGKGRFLMDMARLYPEINFIGIEKYSSVLFRAGRAGSHLPEFFRSVAEGPPREATPGVQTVSGKIRSNPEKRRNDRI